MNKLEAYSAPPNVAPPDRRQHLRFQLAVQIELRPDGTNVPMRLQTSDLGMGGCYVEIALTLDIGTKLDIALWLDQQKVTMRGVVVTRHPQFGNGIEFAGIGPESERLLYSFLDAHGSAWQSNTPPFPIS